MRDLVRYAKAWAVVLIIMRLGFLLGFLVLVVAIIFGGGIEVNFKWSIGHD